MKIVEIYGISEEQGVISCPVEDLLFRLTQREVGAPASGDLNFRGHGDAGMRGRGEILIISD
ncbi:MAG: hypothetical protein KME52_29755 [Desmonostoc geniculatum HA4340-LM1]|jgi:hypothetical protein|nr:hypothetical protein [Desmonostoc geniculatum HA4340-LM1]